MQLGIGAGNHGCGDAGNAWATYGTDGNGDGRRDVYDPADAIPAAGRLSARRGRARRLPRARSSPTTTPAGTSQRSSPRPSATAAPAQPRAHGVRRVPFTGRWLAPVPGTDERCDARIVDDVLYLVHRFGLTVTACFAASGHDVHGEHPLGLAIDVVPVGRQLGPHAGGSAAVRLEPDLRGDWMRRRRPPSHARRPLQRLPRSRRPRALPSRPRARRICTSRGRTAPTEPLSPAPWVEQRRS